MNASWVDKWRGARIFVLGDVMLDRFAYGRVERVSPEAPIPVLHFQSEKAMLGGAANVARNIVGLGGHAILAGVLGADAEGDLVAGLLAAADGDRGPLRQARRPSDDGQDALRLRRTADHAPRRRTPAGARP